MPSTSLSNVTGAELALELVSAAHAATMTINDATQILLNMVPPIQASGIS
jgi:hypothetical protein